MKITRRNNVIVTLIDRLYAQPILKQSESWHGGGMWIIMAHFPNRDKDEFITVTPFFSGPECAHLLAVTQGQYDAWKSQDLYAVRADIS